MGNCCSQTNSSLHPETYKDHGENMKHNFNGSMESSTHCRRGSETSSHISHETHFSDPYKSMQAFRFSSGRQASYKKFVFLIVGTGESGKTTIMKQMRYLHGKPLSDDEKAFYAVHVRSNIFVAMCQLCNLIDVSELAKDEFEAYEEFIEVYEELRSQVKQKSITGISDNYESSDAEKIEFVNKVTHPEVPRRVNANAVFFMQRWEILNMLWKSDAVQHAWTYDRSKMNVIDSHFSFLNRMEEIAQPEYEITTQDFLLARIITTSPRKECYCMEKEKCQFEFIDVGGQRAHRRTWEKYLHRGNASEVDAILFVAALSDYDQSLSETKSEKDNRMIESLALFKSILEYEGFVDKRIPIMLFLNKKDIFRKKIITSPIYCQSDFKDYRGKDFDDGVNYFMSKFRHEASTIGHKRDIYVQTTTATDTEYMRVVMDSVQKMVLDHNMRVNLGWSISLDES